MKICIAALFGKDRGRGGIHSHCRWLMRYFGENSVNYIYVSPFGYYKILVYPVFAVRHLFLRKFKTLSIIWYRLGHYYFLKKALARHIKEKSIDIVQTHCPLSALATIMIRKACRLRYRIILYLAINSSQADEEVWNGNIRKGGLYYKTIKSMEKFVFFNVDEIIFNSNYLREEILQEYPGLKARKTAVIYSGVGYLGKKGDDFSVANAAPQIYRLANIGELIVRKNQQFLLYVMKELAVRFPNIELHLIGDGEKRKNLEELARALGIGGKVKFRGFLRNAHSVMEGSYIYLHSALEESSPMVLIEAMSWGIPSVSFPVGGIPEIIQHGYNGFLVKDKSVKTYTKYIEELIADRAKYATMRQNCLKLFQEKFTYQAMGSRYIEFYKNALNN